MHIGEVSALEIGFMHVFIFMNNSLTQLYKSDFIKCTFAVLSFMCLEVFLA